MGEARPCAAPKFIVIRRRPAAKMDDALGLCGWRRPAVSGPAAHRLSRAPAGRAYQPAPCQRPHDRPNAPPDPPRAAFCVYDQDQARRTRPGAGGARNGAGFDRRLGERCARRGLRCSTSRGHRLSGDDGRPRQTFAPQVHGGLLAIRRGRHAIPGDARPSGIDLLVSISTRSRRRSRRPTISDTIVEQIDIGGPAMIPRRLQEPRLCVGRDRPADYAAVLARHDAGGVTGTDAAHARRQGVRAHRRHDAAISAWFEGWRTGAGEAEALSPRHHFRQPPPGAAHMANPHQRAAFYVTAPPDVATARRWGGS